MTVDMEVVVADNDKLLPVFNTDGWRSCFIGLMANGAGYGGKRGLWYGSKMTLLLSVCNTGLVERPSLVMPADR